MRIEDDIKLDFKDVLIRPKRSKLASRQHVELNRKYTFKYSKQSWIGTPIMAANMDGVGTRQMATLLSSFNMFTCLVKSYTITDWATKITGLNVTNLAVSTGTSDKDYEKLSNILDAVK